jgi:RimJ/RimL family protein N-acetyltransferase
MSRVNSSAGVTYESLDRIEQVTAVTNLEPIRFDSACVTAPAIAPDADWTTGLPVLKGRRIVLRELVKSDALSLLSMLSTEEVAKFISPPPTHAAGVREVRHLGAARTSGRQPVHLRHGA